MGWEYFTYGDKSELERDFDILTLRHFFMDALDSETPAFFQASKDEWHALRDFFKSWDWAGSGIVFGVHFEDFVQGNEKRFLLLIRVLERTAVRLKRFGSLIPLSYLDSYVNEPGARFTAPQSTRRFIRIIAKLRQMILVGTPNPQPSPCRVKSSTSSVKLRRRSPLGKFLHNSLPALGVAFLGNIVAWSWIFVLAGLLALPTINKDPPSPLGNFFLLFGFVALPIALIGTFVFYLMYRKRLLNKHLV